MFFETRCTSYNNTTTQYNTNQYTTGALTQYITPTRSNTTQYRPLKLFYKYSSFWYYRKGGDDLRLRRCTSTYLCEPWFSLARFAKKIFWKFL